MIIILMPELYSFYFFDLIENAASQNINKYPLVGGSSV